MEPEVYITAYASLVQHDPHYDADDEQIAARYRAFDGVCRYVFTPVECLESFANNP